RFGVVESGLAKTYRIMRSELRHNRDKDTTPAPDAGLQTLHQIDHNSTRLPAPETSRVLLSCCRSALVSRPDGIIVFRQGPRTERRRRPRAADSPSILSGARLLEASLYGAETKVIPIRLSLSQTIWHSRTTPSDITRRKRVGTKAGSSMSMAAPSEEMFRTTQLITEPPADTYAGSLISER